MSRSLELEILGFRTGRSAGRINGRSVGVANEASSSLAKEVVRPDATVRESNDDSGIVFGVSFNFEVCWDFVRSEVVLYRTVFFGLSLGSLSAGLLSDGWNPFSWCGGGSIGGAVGGYFGVRPVAIEDFLALRRQRAHSHGDLFDVR